MVQGVKVQYITPHTYATRALPDQRTRSHSITGNLATWAMSSQKLVLEVCVDSVQSAIRLVLLYCCKSDRTELELETVK
jgi:hypothetical protein